jgi:hypothetical protein
MKMKKTMFAVLIALALVTAGFAQRGGRGPGLGGAPSNGATGTGAPRDPAAGLKAALDLTDAQLESIKTLNQSRQETVQSIMTEIRANRHALDAALDVSGANPTTVGNAAIALRTSENKLKTERETYIANLKHILTTLQAETLDKLIAAGTPLPGLGGPGGPGERGRGPRPPQ